MSVVLTFSPQAAKAHQDARRGGSMLDRLSQMFQPRTPAQFARDKKRFQRPENYDKVHDFKDGKQLWCGANDWECGWTWAGIHGKDSRDSDGYVTEPEHWLNVDHDKCPACHGDPDTLKRDTQKKCQEYAKQQVSDWVKKVTKNNIKLSGREGSLVRFASFFDAPAPRTNLTKIPVTRIKEGELAEDHIHAGLAGNKLTIKHGPKDAAGVGRKEDTYQVVPGSPADATHAFVLTGGKQPEQYVTTVGKSDPAKGASCTCKGFKFSKYCKHVAALCGLFSAGKLSGILPAAQPPVPPSPPSTPPASGASAQAISAPASWPVEEEPTRKAIRHEDLRKGVDEQIAGTRLAYHLRQIEARYRDRGPDEKHIADLANQALSGDTGAYAQLGQALEANGDHEFANAYRWGKVKQGLSRDRAISGALNNPNFDEHLAKVLKSGHTKEEFLSRMARLATINFDREIHNRGGMGGQHEKLIKDMDTWRHPVMQNIWNQLKGVAGLSNHKNKALSDKLLAQSIMRHLFREEDRKQISKSRAKTKELAPGKGKQFSWQDFFHMLPGFSGNPENTKRAKKDTSNPERFRRLPIKFGWQDFYRDFGEPVQQPVAQQQPQGPQAGLGWQQAWRDWGYPESEIQRAAGPGYKPPGMQPIQSPIQPQNEPADPKPSELHKANADKLGEAWSGTKSLLKQKAGKGKPKVLRNPVMPKPAQQATAAPLVAQPISQPSQLPMQPAITTQQAGRIARANDKATPQSQREAAVESANGLAAPVPSTPVFHPAGREGQHTQHVYRKKDGLLVATYTGATPEEARARAQQHVDLHAHLRRLYKQAEANTGGKYDSFQPENKRSMVWSHPENKNPVMAANGMHIQPSLREQAFQVLKDLRANAGLPPKAFGVRTKEQLHPLGGTGLRFRRDGKPVRFVDPAWAKTNHDLRNPMMDTPQLAPTQHAPVQPVATLEPKEQPTLNPAEMNITQLMTRLNNHDVIALQPNNRLHKIALRLVANMNSTNPKLLSVFHVVHPTTGEHIASYVAAERNKAESLAKKHRELISLAGGNPEDPGVKQRKEGLLNSMREDLDHPKTSRGVYQASGMELPATGVKLAAKPLTDKVYRNPMSESQSLKRDGIVNRLAKLFGDTDNESQSIAPGLVSAGRMGFPQHLAANDSLSGIVSTLAQSIKSGQRPKMSTQQRRDLEEMLKGLELLVQEQKANGQATPPDEVQKLHDLRAILGYPAGALVLRRDGKPVKFMHAEFQHAIAHSPGDPTPKLIYADWLEENRRPALAELIRLHVHGKDDQAIKPNSYVGNDLRRAPEAIFNSYSRNAPAAEPEINSNMWDSDETGPFASVSVHGTSGEPGGNGYYRMLTHHTKNIDLVRRVAEEAGATPDMLGHIDAHAMRQKILNKPDPKKMQRRGQPAKLSAPGWPNTESDLASALQRMHSANHDGFVQAVGSAFNAMALSPHKVSPVIHNSSGSSQPAVAASIGRPVDKQSAEYAAAWLGQLAHQSGVLAFHADPNGPDSLYHFDVPGSGQPITAALNAQGISQSIMRPKAAGFSVTIHDPSRRMRKQVANVARQFGTTVGEARGTGIQLGGDDPAEARETYRGIIGKFEGQTQRPRTQMSRSS